jgi:hypothetical protein
MLIVSGFNIKLNVMSIEKIFAVIGDKEYSFTVEIMSSEDGTIFRVTPDQDKTVVDNVIDSYIDFDEKGQIQSEEELIQPRAREITDAVWRAVKEQIIEEHPSFNQPL